MRARRRIIYVDVNVNLGQNHLCASTLCRALAALGRCD